MLRVTIGARFVKLARTPRAVNRQFVMSAAKLVAAQVVVGVAFRFALDKGRLAAASRPACRGSPGALLKRLGKPIRCQPNLLWHWHASTSPSENTHTNGMGQSMQKRLQNRYMCTSLSNLLQSICERGGLR